MKYIRKLLLLALIAMISVGCEDVINVTQKGTLPPEATFSTVPDLNKGLRSVYAQVDIFEEIYFSADFTDEISIGFGNGGQGVALYHWQLNPGSTMPAAVWVENYDAINKATRLIVAAKEIEPPSNLQARYNVILGQAYAIRAFEYFNLLKYFSADITDDGSLGVVLFTGIPDINAELPRSTTGESFQFINNDLAKADSLIPPTYNPPEGIHFTHNAITALRARMALYRQHYPEAETFSQTLVDKLSLASPQDYVDMFMKGTRGEVIFKLERTVGGPYDQQADDLDPSGFGWIGNVFAQVTATQGAHFEVSRSLYNLIEDDDIRLHIISNPASIIVEDYSNLTSSEFFKADLNYVNKYRGYVQPLITDQYVFRVSEMVLINAEAKAAQGDLIGAALMVDKLRNIRHTQTDPLLPVYSSKAEAFADILEARRVELAFEGHRFFDLRRLGPKIGAEIDRATIDCKHTGACVGPIPGENKKYVLPIPLVELNANSNIQQNPGYGGGS